MSHNPSSNNPPSPLSAARRELLFLQALEQPPERREAWLERECAGDESLLVDLRELIRFATKNEDGLLDAPAAAPMEQIPTRIGTYRVSRLLGAGGVGAVFDATHEGTGRRAAVKLIRTGFNTTRQRIRFQVEAELLAKLNHPGIAQLYDAGVADVHYGTDDKVAARPFIAMEFVDGVTIVAHARSRSLSTRERVELLHDTALAVAHANQRGVIHRDLKPGNVLVSHVDGRPKIVDFGIARLVEGAEGMTVEGVAMGTPSYMSPEQLAGDVARIDLPTDVYGLAAVLYTLLAGRAPIEATGLLTPTLAMRLLAAEPVPLRTLSPAIDRDLAAVVHKALERNPSHRYENASTFADDLHRWLSKRPTHARPIGLGRRIVKAMRRRPRLTAAAAVGTVAVLSLAGIAIWQAWEAGRAFDQERRAVRDQRAAVDYFSNLLLRASPDSREGLGADYRLADLINQANREIDALADRPAVQADVRLTLGKIYLALGKLNEAEANLKAAVAAKQSLGAAEEEIIAAKESLARLLQERNLWEEARRLRQDVFYWYRDHAGPENAETYRTLVEYSITANIAGVSIQERNLHQVLSDFDELRVRRGSAWTISEELSLLRAHELGAYWQMELVDQQLQGKHYLEAAEEQAQRLLGPDHPTTLRLLRTRGIAMVRRGDYAMALPVLRSANERLSQRLGKAHPTVLSLESTIASCMGELGDVSTALTINDQTEAALTQMIGESNLRTIQVRQGRAHLLALAGRYDEADALLQDCLARYTASPGPRGYFVQAVWMQISDLRRRQKRFEEVVKIHRERGFPVDHDKVRGELVNGEVAKWHLQYAEALARTGDHAFALELSDFVVRSLRASYGDEAAVTKQAQAFYDSIRPK